MEVAPITPPAPAPVAECSAPALGFTHAAPDPVSEHASPTPGVSCETPAPVTAYVAPAPLVTNAAPVPRDSHNATLVHGVTFEALASVTADRPSSTVAHEAPALVVDSSTWRHQVQWALTWPQHLLSTVRNQPLWSNTCPWHLLFCAQHLLQWPTQFMIGSWLRSCSTAT